MEKVIVEIGFTGNNFGASVPLLQGCVAAADSPGEIKRYIKEAIEMHVAGILEDGDELPAALAGEYELAYKFDVPNLLKYYKGILGNTALERLTGISNKQLNHYATGLKRPTAQTIEKIENALHAFGRELIAVELGA